MYNLEINYLSIYLILFRISIAALVFAIILPTCYKMEFEQTVTYLWGSKGYTISVFLRFKAMTYISLYCIFGEVDCRMLISLKSKSGLQERHLEQVLTWTEKYAVYVIVRDNTYDIICIWH